MKFFKTPYLIKAWYRSSIWEIPGNEKKLYLTFDDGPQPKLTDYILNTLHQYHAKATFFCVGDNIRKYPDLAKKIIDQGHEIGNHTYNHLSGWGTDTKVYIENMERCEEEISKITGRGSSCLFRPPYGKISSRQSKSIKDKGFNIIMWDILSYDFDKNLNVNKADSQIKNKTKGGSIVLFHDNYKAQENLEYLLPKYLEYFTSRGFQFSVIPSNFK